MSRVTWKFLGAALVAGLLGACEGSVNDDSNFFVLTSRTSTSSANAQANGPSGRPALTPDGRFLVFESKATNIAPGDTNNKQDIFRKDLQTGEVIIVSVDSTGVQANGDSFRPSVSPDGRFVAFESAATNLVTLGEGNGAIDIYVRDIDANTTVRASLTSAGAEGPADSLRPDISADGRYVVFDTISPLSPVDGGVDSDVFVRDLQLNTTTLVSVNAGGGDAAGDSQRAVISDDGTLIAFDSTSSTILPAGQDTNGAPDVFVITWQAPVPIVDRISVEHPTNPDEDTDGNNADGNSVTPRLSADGRFVAFISDADDLVPGDSNRGAGPVFITDIFIRDRALGTTSRVSVSSQGGEPTRACLEPGISGDGRWVVFTSESPDLVTGDTNNTPDIFLRDTVNLRTTRVSVATYGVQSADFFPSTSATISSDGRLVAFASSAPNLAPNDTNGLTDVFVRGPLY
jgi:Tol biopolymer transport system component